MLLNVLLKINATRIFGKLGEVIHVYSPVVENQQLLYMYWTYKSTFFLRSYLQKYRGEIALSGGRR